MSTSVRETRDIHVARHTPPLRVALVCHEYPPSSHGGIGTFTQVLARTLVQNGHSVRVVGVYVSASEPLLQDDNGVQVYRLRAPAYDKRSVRARIRLFRQLSEWARACDIDLIEVPDAEGWAAFWPSLNMPVITRVHGSISYFGREALRSRSIASLTAFLVERASARRSDFWCAVSQYSGQKTQELFGLARPPGSVSFVPVDVPPPVPFTSRRAGRVVYTGTLTRKKGVYSLARAWERVTERCRFAELHIFGKGDEGVRQQLRSTAGEKAAATMYFHGHTARTELLKELQHARVAVFPSYAEAFAFAPLEAMACGCPTIYSRRTSGSEAVCHNRDGLLIDPDSPDEIADAIVRLLADEAFAQEVGHSGRERVVANFTAARIVPAIEEFYRECVAAFSRQ